MNGWVAKRYAWCGMNGPGHTMSSCRPRGDQSVVGSRAVCYRELPTLSRQAPGSRTARDGAREIEGPRSRGLVSAPGPCLTRNWIAGERRGGQVSGRQRRTPAGSAMSSVEARHTKWKVAQKPTTASSGRNWPMSECQLATVDNRNWKTSCFASPLGTTHHRAFRSVPQTLTLIRKEGADHAISDSMVAPRLNLRGCAGAR
jgi:hypothetical protein